MFYKFDDNEYADDAEGQQELLEAVSTDVCSGARFALDEDTTQKEVRNDPYAELVRRHLWGLGIWRDVD